MRGEDVDAADNEHVVRAAHRLGHSYMGSSAGAGRTVQNADVTGPVTEQGKGLFGDGGEHQFPLGAVREHLAGIGIDDLRDEMILTDVHAFLFAALVGDPGTGELGEPVDIIGFDPQLVLNILAHFL